MIYHLAPSGRIGMVLANGSLSSQSGGEGNIRKNIINADLVECIVAMPTQLFYTTQIPVSLWFLNKQKKQTGKTLFIDARKMGKMVNRKLRELMDEDIRKIADTYMAFVDGMLEDVKGLRQKLQWINLCHLQREYQMWKNRHSREEVNFATEIQSWLELRHALKMERLHMLIFLKKMRSLLVLQSILL